MKKVYEELAGGVAALLKVKSIITLVLLIVFSILAVRGTVSTEQVVSIFMVIIGFYFGTQANKDNGNVIELRPEDFENYEDYEETPDETTTTHAIGFAVNDVEEEEEDG